ncbi:MAG TPA: zinc-dependent peptidase, partial [Burkholderiales bacterium]|nr:zinc-dependent peptidase [Burkholderiales bacterium]
MTGPLRRWWRQRIIARAALDPALWEQTLQRLPFLDGLTAHERARLRDTVILFLHSKSIHGAAGLVIDDGMRLMIAAQACILILNLDVDYFSG